MECTIYKRSMWKSQRNTTRFPYSRFIGSITMTTDWNGGLLIKAGVTSPVYLHDVSREDIGYSRKQARELMRQQ